MTEILRALSARETMLLKRPSSQSFVNSMRIKSKINLFENIELVKNAIHKWKILHPFLQANISPKDNDKFYFEINSNNSANKNLENVNLFYLNLDYKNLSKAHECEILNEISSLWIEKEFSNLITEKDTLLWRLTFLSIKSDELNNEFTYEVVLFLNHTISEGRNSSVIFFQLIDIISKLYNTENFSDLDKYKVFPSVEDFLIDYPKDLTGPVSSPILFRPKFLAHAKDTAFEMPEILKNYDFLNEKLVSIMNKDCVIELKDLLEISKRNCSKIKRLIIDKEKSLKLIQKCKQERVKVSSCLDLIVIISFKKLYRKYDLELKDIVFYTSICLRNLENSEDLQYLDDANMGFYVGGLLRIFKNNYDQNFEEILKDFWKISKNMSDEFHSDLAQNKNKYCPKFKAWINPMKK
ncbi:unnamed protein product [Brachionus calyciflorus]|uniref:Alcohol acetyltransferase n=1 Tax=Brachionus calyciflorus TaxID=104777 RepID=A0A813M867_9BILA|nr:unnamed protein product [Brachionus calyciflorus]